MRRRGEILCYVSAVCTYVVRVSSCPGYCNKENGGSKKNPVVWKLGIRYNGMNPSSSSPPPFVMSICNLKKKNLENLNTFLFESGTGMFVMSGRYKGDVCFEKQKENIKLLKRPQRER